MKFSTPNFDYTERFKYSKQWFDKYKSSNAQVRMEDRDTLSAIGNVLGKVSRSGIVGTLLQAGINIFQNKRNEEFQREINDTNTAYIEKENALSRQEAEKAYQRSLPTQQVANMVNVGMSHAGAINALSGGGSYSPAPVSAAQDEAPQVDYSSAVNAIQSMMTNKLERDKLKQQERQFNKQMSLEERKQDFAEHQYHNEADIRNKTRDNLDAQNKILNKTAEKLGFETSITETNSKILQAVYSSEIDAQLAENLLRKLIAENQKFIEELRSEGMEKLDRDEFKLALSNIVQRKTLETTLQMFLDYSKEHGNKIGKELLKEAFEQSITRGAPLTSAVL